MLIVVDANVLVSDKGRQKPVWSDAPANGDRFLVPEVAFLEFVAHRGRELDGLISALKAAPSIHSAVRGRGHLAREIEELKLARPHVEQTEREMFAFEKIDIVPLPDGIMHLDLVRRAADRIRPFNDQGNGGYRDTLIWLTVLELAKSNPDDEVVLVSNDSTAFATSKNSPELHRCLADELKKEALEDRVRWVRTLDELQIPPAPDAPPELLRRRALFDFLEQSLLDKSYSADMQALGFPAGVAVNVTPKNVLTAVYPLSAGGDRLWSFIVSALCDIDPTPLYGWIRPYATFGDVSQRRPFLFAGTAICSPEDGLFTHLVIDSVTPDVSIDWQ